MAQTEPTQGQPSRLLFSGLFVVIQSPICALLEALEPWKLELRIYSLHKSLLLAASRVFVDNLDARVSEQELEDEFQTYGVIRRVWLRESHRAMLLSTLMIVEMLKI